MRLLLRGHESKHMFINRVFDLWSRAAFLPVSFVETIPGIDMMQNPLTPS